MEFDKIVDFWGKFQKVWIKQFGLVSGNLHFHKQPGDSDSDSLKDILWRNTEHNWIL